MMQKRRLKMDEIVRALNYTLDCSSQRLRWYIETGDKKYMTDCEMYLRVANIYMGQIDSMEQKNEV
jgi:hypothetical protein